MEAKSLRARSESLKSRLPQIKSANRYISLEKATNESLRLIKPNMMISEREDEDSVFCNSIPAVQTDKNIKFLIFRAIFIAERPPAPSNSGFFFKFLGNEVKLIR